MNIKYAIVKNEMPASSTEAKYLGKIIPNGVRNRSQMTALALKSEHFAEATFAAVIDAAVDITQELCAEGHDVDWGTVKFLSKMHGSLPYEDSSFSDGTASLTLDADATNVTRTILDTLVPVKASAAEINSLIKVSNIMDVATEAFGTVIGSTPFAVLGNGITLDAAGEYVKALDKKTGEVKGTATVQSVSKGQRAYAKFDPQLAGGDYTLEIATKGLIGEATPRIFHKPVTAVYAPPVPLFEDTAIGLKVMSVTKSDGGMPEHGLEWNMHGEGLIRPMPGVGGFSSLSAKVDGGTEPFELVPTVVDGSLLKFTPDFGTLSAGEHVAHFTMSTMKADDTPSKTGTFDVTFKVS